VARALAVVSDPAAASKQRRQFIEILGETKRAEAVPSLLGVLTNSVDPVMQRATLTALLPFEVPEIGRAVVVRYPTFTGEVRTAAQTLVASRAAWTGQFLDAVEAGRISAAAVPRDFVRRIQVQRDPALAARITTLWPQSGRPTTGDMSNQIQRLTQVIGSGPGRPYPGRELFRAACASCHRLYQEGGQVGPDLTAYQRSDWENLLLHVVNPSAEIREGYENYTAETKDGRTLSGFLVERDAARVVLRGVDGQNVTLGRAEIEELRGSGLSLMPEGLLDGLTDVQVRDLFAYLRGTQPLTGK
jgi:putative heme-binding domain-containing protein